jgi:putative transposase
LREHELGAKTADLCRKHRISKATFYNWKSKFGGMDVSEARRLMQPEGENARLKKLLADSMLDNAAQKDLLSKNMVTPAVEREAVAPSPSAGVPGDRLRADDSALSISPGRRRGFARTVADARRERPRFGYRTPHVLLCREGFIVNHTRLFGIYREE